VASAGSRLAAWVGFQLPSVSRIRGKVGAMDGMVAMRVSVSGLKHGLAYAYG
jgi:hypothetical protein